MVEGTDVGLHKLLFELASESRLGILRELNARPLRMQELARSLDMTDTETCRQLHRLSEARLIQKMPDGTYTITEFAKLEMFLGTSMDFVLRHREYFSDHDIWLLPGQFIGRIGELAGTTHVMETLESVGRIEQIMQDAEDFVWGIGEGKVTESMKSTAKGRIGKGVNYRVLSPFPPARQPNIENRTLSPTPVFAVLTEKEAVVCFRFSDGRMDYAGFVGEDEEFLGWTRDLFLFYWNRGSQS